MIINHHLRSYFYHYIMWSWFRFIWLMYNFFIFYRACGLNYQHITCMSRSKQMLYIRQEIPSLNVMWVYQSHASYPFCREFSFQLEMHIVNQFIIYLIKVVSEKKRKKEKIHVHDIKSRQQVNKIEHYKREMQKKEMQVRKRIKKCYYNRPNF